MARHKADAYLVAAGVVALVVIYPLVWLHERIGTTGLVFLGLVVAGWALFKYQAARKWQRQRNAALLKRFETDAIQAMKGQHRRPDTVVVIKNRYRDSPWNMALIRQLQLFGESAQLALESHNPQTASSRFDTAMAAYQEAMESKPALSGSVIWMELQECRSKLVESFPCVWRINAATALLKQAEGLKTNAAKRKRWLQVVELLSDPQATPTPEMQRLLASTQALLASPQETHDA